MSVAETGRDRLAELADRAEIRDLCDRYAVFLDKYSGDDSWYESVFTEDVWLRFPIGEYQGRAGLEEFHRASRENFERTHHLSGNYDIEVTGETAAVRGHLVATHLPKIAEPSTHFDIGGYYDAESVRTPRGWRFRRFAFTLVWTSGARPDVDRLEFG